MVMGKLYKLINEALINADTNGYDHRDYTAEELTNDLMDYDSDIARYSRDDVVAVVKQVLGQDL